MQPIKKGQIYLSSGTSPFTLTQPLQAVLAETVTPQSPLIWCHSYSKFISWELQRQALHSARSDCWRCSTTLHRRAGFPEQRQPAQHRASIAPFLLLILTSLWVYVLGLFQRWSLPCWKLSLLFLPDCTCLHGCFVCLTLGSASPHVQQIFLIPATSWPRWCAQSLHLRFDRKQPNH